MYNCARSEAFRAKKMKVEVFWVVTPCSVVVGIGILPQHYTASQPGPGLEFLNTHVITCRGTRFCATLTLPANDMTDVRCRRVGEP